MFRYSKRKQWYTFQLLVQLNNKDFEGVLQWRLFLALVAFHWALTSGNFREEIKCNGPFWFLLTEIYRTALEGGPLWPVQSFRSVGPKRPFPFEKVNCFSLQPLFSSLLKSTISRRDLARVGSVQPMFISIGQTGIFVQWKAPLNCFHGPFLKILVSVAWQLNLFIFISRTLPWEWFNTETPYL